ncbi:transmembrane protein 216 isoform X1 [Octodon degus]|uniref:Transmembrane protein 216 n=1 Tax=Octodon degus TaxID=10160 RepID=A0A6P6DRY2_OCTDE|nr:transmembrane protein 216 isoform X1 [Octodon degus]
MRGGREAGVCKRLSSTPLEVLFFLNGWYCATYFLLELFLFLYKGLLLPYPAANLVLDVVMLLLYLGIEVVRLFFVWTRFEVQTLQPVARQADTHCSTSAPALKSGGCVVLPGKGHTAFCQHRHPGSLLDDQWAPSARRLLHGGRGRLAPSWPLSDSSWPSSSPL